MEDVSDALLKGVQGAKEHPTELLFHMLPKAFDRIELRTIVMRAFQKETFPTQRLHRAIEIKGFKLPLQLGTGQDHEPPRERFEPKASFIIAPAKAGSSVP
ncbi:hypothetical protein IB75_06965 [Nitrosococcus oceani C-27]|uniref:Uncharacterized protein n=1 Tax=Nitrosococcus oceani C-27 TaxID=314279 RepID=A0A0E2Z3E3_9GAMM|nr:hypothetical protein IB75_06965 [Nitrosococcus oceani C-27]